MDHNDNFLNDLGPGMDLNGYRDLKYSLAKGNRIVIQNLLPKVISLV